jgi:hypothetical protein
MLYGVVEGLRRERSNGGDSKVVESIGTEKEDIKGVDGGEREMEMDSEELLSGVEVDGPYESMA